MSIETLSLKSLGKLDEQKVEKALAVHLRRAAQDCYDRPGDKTARKVTMTFTLEPVLEVDGSSNEVKTQIQIASSLPAHRTKVYSMGLKPNGTVLFNPDSLDNVDQGTLLPEDEDDDR